jgi:tripartite ATP-independent transporter DctP family solute receptor
MEPSSRSQENQPRRILMKRSLALLLFLALLSFLPGAASAKTVLKYGHVAPPSHGQHLGCLAFAEHVKNKTHGEIQVDVFPMGQLGGERSMMEQIQGGTLDLCASTTGVVANFVPEVALFDLPFLWPGREVAYRGLDDKDLQKIFFDLFPKKGMVAIGYTENDMRDITNIKREIRKPDDLKGLKIRVIESPVYLDSFRALGASPVPMPFPEIYNALQQGVIDAQDNPILTSILMKFTEVCPYATLTNHVLTECILVVNVDVWNRLTPAQQQVFREAAQVGLQVNRDKCKEMRDRLIKDAVEQKGLKVTELTPEERAAFMQAVTSVHKKYEEKAGKISRKPEYGKFGGMSYYQMIQEKIKRYR